MEAEFGPYVQYLAPNSHVTYWWFVVENNSKAARMILICSLVTNLAEKEYCFPMYTKSNTFAK